MEILNKNSSITSSKYLKNSTLQKNFSIPLLQIKELYFAKCQDLGLGFNRTQESNFIKTFQKTCQNRSLNLENMSLGLSSSKHLSQILLTSTCLARLNLSKNQLGNKGCLQICESISKNQCIIDINLSNNNINFFGSSEVLRNLATEHLISVNLSSKENFNKNVLGDCENIELLINSKTLLYLNLANTGISVDGCQKIIFSLKNNKNLLALDLSGNKNIGVNFKEFINSVKSTNLHELFISSVKLKDNNCKYLADLIKSSTFIQKLEVSNNFFTSLGISEIFSVLAFNTYISVLNINKNSLEKGVPYTISDLFNENLKLEELFMSGCFIKNDTKYFMNGLSSSLIKLDLSFNEILSKGAELLAAGLKKNHSLQILDLSFNKIKNKGGIALGKALADNKNFQELYFKDNGLKNKAAEVLSNLCRTNKNIKILDLSLNPVHIKYLQTIDQILKKRKDSELKNTENLKKSLQSLKKLTESSDEIYGLLEFKKNEVQKQKKKIERQTAKIEEIKGFESARIADIQKEFKVFHEFYIAKTEFYNKLCKEKTVSSMKEFEKYSKNTQETLQKELEKLDEKLGFLQTKST